MWCSSRWHTPEPAARARRRIVAALGLLALPLAGNAAANDEAPAFVREHFPGRLVGAARLTWFGFHVYDARLYAATMLDANEPAAQPFALELTYARALDGKAIARTSRDEIARLGFGSDAQRQAWFGQMARLFPDVERGRRIAAVNLPGQGVRFYVDGAFAGSIDDLEFARAFFAIWLDVRTQSPDVRAGLLRSASAQGE